MSKHEVQGVRRRMQRVHPPALAPCGVALLARGRAPCAPLADVSPAAPSAATQHMVQVQTEPQAKPAKAPDTPGRLRAEQQRGATACAGSRGGAAGPAGVGAAARCDVEPGGASRCAMPEPCGAPAVFELPAPAPSRDCAERAHGLHPNHEVACRAPHAPCSLDAACTLPNQGALCASARADRHAAGTIPP